jgi:hypothetical protein
MMSAPIEAKLLPVLEVTANAMRTGDWSAKSYESALDRLLASKTPASVEALIALLDYPISAAYSELVSCRLATGGKRALHLLELYDRCDIAPSRSPVKRNHPGLLRGLTIASWRAGGGKGSCDTN